MLGLGLTTLLLFIIFVNDLADSVVSKIHKFADDTKIVSKVANDDEIKMLQLVRFK